MRDFQNSPVKKRGEPLKRENGAGREERNAAGRTRERLELIIEAADKLSDVFIQQSVFIRV